MDEVDREYLQFLDILDRAIDHAGSNKIITVKEYNLAKDLITHSLKREKANGHK